MSYDLYLFKAVPGVSPKELAARFLSWEGEDPGSAVPEKERRKEELASALQRLDPNLERFAIDFESLARDEGTTVEEARRRYRDVELNAPDGGNGLQIMLFDDYASVALPYRPQSEEADDAWAEVWDCLETLCSAAGWSVYDPQLERLLDQGRDRLTVQDAYARGAASALRAEGGERD